MMGAGWKDRISSYRSSFNCSLLISSLCTVHTRSSLMKEEGYRRLTIEFEELGIKGRRNRLIVWVVLSNISGRYLIMRTKVFMCIHMLPGKDAQARLQP